MMPAVALLVVGTFAGHAIAGPNGLFAWRGYAQQLEVRKTELAALQAEHAQLKHRRRCSTRAGPIPTWPTKWSARTWAWSAADEVVVPLED